MLKAKKAKVSDLQFKKFLLICQENDEFLFGSKRQLKAQLKHVLAFQGYWSGEYVRYYWDGKDWKTKERVFGR
jgi:hypothetical protein